MPGVIMYEKAPYKKPPSHPYDMKFLGQSNNYWTDNGG